MEAMLVTRRDYDKAPRLEAALKDLKIPMVKRELCLAGQKSRLDRFQAVVREDTGEVLSVVSPAYKLVAHDEAVRPALKFLTEGGWEVKRAVTERNGAHCHVELFNRAQSFLPEEQLYPRLVISNAVDLRGSMKFRLGIYRLVCSNGLMVPDTRFKMGLHVRQVHLGDVEGALKKLGAELQHKVGEIMKLGQTFRALMNHRVESTEAEDVLRKVVGKRQLERVMYLWEHAPGQPKDYRTSWGLYNGLTYWLTHEAKGGVYQRDLKSQQALRVMMPRLLQH